jgi:hypothetical protein
MFSRTARIAAVLILLQTGAALAMPAPRTTAARFDCGDPGPHLCCIPDSRCSSGSFCCEYDADGNQGECGCGGIE